MFIRCHSTGRETTVYTIDLFAECYANVASIDNIQDIECVQRHFIVKATCGAGPRARVKFKVTEPASGLFIVHGVLPEREDWHQWTTEEIDEVVGDWLERSINWIETKLDGSEGKGINTPRITEVTA